MNFPDLSLLPETFAAEFPKPLAIGWLEPEHEYSHGFVPEPIVRKLAELLREPWQPFVTGGRHQCGFCRFSGGPPSFQFLDARGERPVSVGHLNLWVPATDVVYVAPSLILHYIDSHEYSPPAEFQAAVSACPPMRSMDYLRAIVRHRSRGPRAN